LGVVHARHDGDNDAVFTSLDCRRGVSPNRSFGANSRTPISVSFRRHGRLNDLLFVVRNVTVYAVGDLFLKTSSSLRRCKKYLSINLHRRSPFPLSRRR
jgi:hypothetical protein